jgi:alginate O-acetyltransferase complex protein AlgI
MVLGGLWHGAALHFVVWGAYQGIMLIIHKELKQLTDGIAWVAELKKTKLFYALSVFVTFHLVCIGWVFFRADTFKAAVDIIRKLLFVDVLANVPATALTIVTTADPVIFMLLPMVIGVLFLGQILSAWLAQRKQPLVVALPVRAVYLAAMIALLLVFSPDTSPKFIYFQF